MLSSDRTNWRSVLLIQPDDRTFPMGVTQSEHSFYNWQVARLKSDQKCIPKRTYHRNIHLGGMILLIWDLLVSCKNSDGSSYSAVGV